MVFEKVSSHFLKKMTINTIGKKMLLLFLVYKTFSYLKLDFQKNFLDIVRFLGVSCFVEDIKSESSLVMVGHF